MRLPEFFIIGAAKCGTTTLHGLLCRHPSIFLTAQKEPHFFDNDRYYGLGVDRYLETHFAGSDDFPVRGEATPYLQFRKVLPRIGAMYDGAGSPRLIVILRDPVERCWSHYLHMVRTTHETETFERALELEEARMTSDGPVWWFGYFRDGLYTRQLQPWIDRFGRDAMHVLFNEDLRRDREATLRGLFRFLGVEEGVEIAVGSDRNRAATPRSKVLARALNQPSALKNALKRVMPGWAGKRIKEALNRRNLRVWRDDEKPVMAPATADRLRAAYADEVAAVEALTGRSLDAWRTGPGINSID